MGRAGKGFGGGGNFEIRPDALFGQQVTSFWLFWYFFEDFTSWGRALFGGFHVLGASTFCTFLRISRPGGEHFLRFFEDFTSWGRALFALFGGF